jgi:hypothetical protein
MKTYTGTKGAEPTRPNDPRSTGAIAPKPRPLDTDPARGTRR